ncbi:MAG: tripartite tricarboxylate transporter permease, partial [Xanthobacteraceae bacterium]
PIWILGPAVLLVAIFGTYSLRSNWGDVGLLMIAGGAGYLLRKAALDAGPFAMAFILANIMDTSLRQALLMGDGNMSIIVTRPISATIIGVTSLVVAYTVYSYFKAGRTQQFARPDNS